ncbi:MAG: nucleotidyltransferase family protein [Mycobacteriales bacterium]
MSIDFEDLRPQLAALCQKYGIAELSVFGSVARGDDRPDSDVDFLYVRGADSVLGMAFFGMQEELEELLGRKVDLVPKDNLHWVIKDRVLADARAVYAA